MSQKMNKKEKTMDLQKNKVILQVTRLLERQNLITSSERMRISELLRKGQ